MKKRQKKSLTLNTERDGRDDALNWKLVFPITVLGTCNDHIP